MSGLFKRDELSNIVDALGDSVKLMHFVEKYNRELKTVRDEVQKFFIKIEITDDEATLDESLSKSLDIMYKALESTVRARNSKIRKRIKNLMNLIEKHKSIPLFIRSIVASKKLLLLFKSLYFYQIDEHMQLTMFYEDTLIFGDIRKMTSEAASIYEDSISNVMSGEIMTNQAKALADKIKSAGTEATSLIGDDDEIP